MKKKPFSSSLPTMSWGEPLVHLDENVSVLFIISTLVLLAGDKKYLFVVSPDDSVETTLSSLFKICSQRAHEPLEYGNIDHLQLPNGRKLRPLQFGHPILAFIGQDDRILVKMRFSWQRELADGMAYFVVFFVLAALVLFVVLQLALIARSLRTA